jgi:hypothetical protein
MTPLALLRPWWVAVLGEHRRNIELMSMAYQAIPRGSSSHVAKKSAT